MKGRTAETWNILLSHRSGEKTTGPAPFTSSLLRPGTSTLKMYEVGVSWMSTAPRPTPGNGATLELVLQRVRVGETGMLFSTLTVTSATPGSSATLQVVLHHVKDSQQDWCVVCLAKVAS